MIKHLRKTGRPIVLTVNGKPEAVVQSAEAYQRLLTIARKANPQEGIRQGRQAAAEGCTRPAREVFHELSKKHI